MLAQNIKRIFEDLDEAAVRILSIMASNRKEMTAYDVWRESKQRAQRGREEKEKEIPIRTIYGKMHWLSRQGQGYVVKVGEEDFKKKLVKVYYDVTLKGTLAALADEKLSFSGVFLQRIRTKLHIPKAYERAVKPIILIWAYRESGVAKFEPRKIDAESIFISVMETIAASKDIGVYSMIRKQLELPPITEFREKLQITDEENETLNRFLSMLFLFEFPQKFELDKRTLPYASGLAPIPWLADCIEILPDVGIRIVWASSKWKTWTKKDYMFWLLIHRDIADFISKGDREGLDQLLDKFLSELVMNWLPMCFRLELDRMCSVNNKECPFHSPLECDTVRKHAENFKEYLGCVISDLQEDNRVT